MKELIVRQYIADAFTDTVFKGNPAAICLLQNWISGVCQEFCVNRFNKQHRIAA